MLFGIVALLLVGVVALVIDVGRLRNARGEAQTAADAGALAGATGQLAHMPAKSVADLAADYAFRNLGLQPPSRLSCGTGCFSYLKNGVTVTVTPSMNHPTKAGTYVRLVVCWNLPTTFAAAVGVENMRPCGTAIAGVAETGAASGCVLCVLGETGSTLQLSGSTKIDVVNGDVAVNSTAADALLISGTSARITVSPAAEHQISLTGGYSIPDLAQVNPIPLTYQPPVEDPFASLAPIAWDMPNWGSVSGGKSDVYLQPGIYDDISGSNGTIHLAPGVYVIRGGIKLTGTASVTVPTIVGSDVLIYLACPSYPIGCLPGELGAEIRTSGGSYVSLSGIEDTASAYHGLVLMSDPNNASRVELVGHSGLTLAGSVYARSGTVELRGTSDVTGTPDLLDYYSLFVARAVEVSGDAQINLQFVPQSNPDAVTKLQLTGLVG